MIVFAVVDTPEEVVELAKSSDYLLIFVFLWRSDMCYMYLNPIPSHGLDCFPF
jgi:hypothetical protein